MKLFYFTHNHATKHLPMAVTKLTFVELTFVISGSLTYYIDRKMVNLKQDDVICVNENSFRSRKSIEHANYVSFNFYKENENDEFSLPLHIKGGLTNEIKLLLNACDEIHSQFFDATERLTLILKCIIKQLEINVISRNYNPLTLKIMQYIAENINKPITLADVSAATFYSAGYCSNVFRKETGRSITNYIIDEKLNKARELIISGVNLKDVSEMLGFSDYNYFSRTFKKRFSYSPIHLKNNNF